MTRIKRDVKEAQIMKKVFLVCSLVVALTSVMAFNAGATPITGAISFSGTSISDIPNLTLATAFTGFSNVVVSTTGGTGDYASVASGTPVTFKPFTFSPALAPNPLVDLWKFSSGGDIYSFDATGVSVTGKSQFTITMEGTGIAKIDGFDDTPGNWYFSANNAGGTATFSVSNDVKGVPEPATLLLLGMGLVGLSGFARKKFRN
jgi:hypothetical protein